MKKIYLLLAACLAVLSVHAQSVGTFADVAAEKTAGKVAIKVSGVKAADSRLARGGAVVGSVGTPVRVPVADVSSLSQLSQKTLSASSGKAVRKLPSGVGTRKAVSSADFPASGLQIDYTTGNAFSKASAVTATLSGNTLTIGNFGGYGKNITATVDLQTGEFTIPRQSAYTSSTYGNCDIIHVNDGYTSYDTTAVVKGNIANGVINIEPWVLYISDGQYKGYILNGVVTASVIKASNASMTVSELDTLNNATTHEYPVIAEQTATNKVLVTNFAGLGKQIEITINGDSTMSIIPQLVYSIQNTGNFFIYSFNPATREIITRLPVKGTTTNNVLSWGSNIIATGSGNFIHMYQSGSLALPFALRYPAAQTQNGWKGSGTADDPWLIETPADLIALADSVNFNTPANVNVNARAGWVARAFEGKYFKVAKYIDMSGYKFDPIGGTDEHYRFGGTFDGDNKTIANLTVNVDGVSNAGLFGAADTTSVIKNVRMSNPNITNTYYYTGAVVGYSRGVVENCAVTNPTINGTLVTGGVAGLAQKCSNLSVTGGTITSDSEVGGAVAVTYNSASNLTVTNVDITTVATGTSNQIGGVVGYFGNSDSTVLSDCYFSGTLITTHNGPFAGGIVGTNTEGVIERCFAVAQIGSYSVATSSSAFGGIVGGTQGGKVKDCLFTGEIVPVSRNVGSIVGYGVALHVDSVHADHIDIENCLVSGINNTASTQGYSPYLGYYEGSASIKAAAKPVVVTNSYYDAQIMPTITTKLGAKKTAELTSADGLAGFNSDVWTFQDGIYPTLKANASTSVAKVASAAFQFADTVQNVSSITSNFEGKAASGVKFYLNNGGKNSSEGHALLIPSGTSQYQLKGTMGADTLVAYANDAFRYVIVKVAPASIFDGEGTAEKPYLIKNKADLIKLSDATYKNQMPYDGTYFLITNDIDLEGDTLFNGIAPNGSGTASRMYSFGGILDGGNHYIHNIKMIKCHADADGNVVGNTSSSSASGFVNTLKDNGTVKNVRIASDCYFEFYSRSGAVVGYNFGGVIDSCRNYANVIAHSGVVGGITGYNSKGGLISNCYNAGNITAGYQNAGGIVATNQGDVIGCENVGEIGVRQINNKYRVNRMSAAGGIVQSNFGTLRNCLNTGYVHAPMYVGGILAWFNGTKGAEILSNCVNVGMISYNSIDEPKDAYTDISGKDQTIGSIVGKLYHDGTFANTYYDKQISIYKDAHNKNFDGIDGLTTNQLTSGEPLAGLDPAVWSFAKGRYPMLKAFADEPGAQAGAQSVVWLDNSVRIDSIKHDARLNKVEGLKWTVADGKQAFQVKDSLLWMDPADVLSDTLVASVNGFEKRIPVTAVPDSVPQPTITITEDGGTYAVFGDLLEGVTYYYTLDGTVPVIPGSESADSVKLASGDITITVKAAKHNYYASAPVVKTVSVSGIRSVTGNVSDDDIAERMYVSPSGTVSSEPVNGINIVVTKYKDGTRSVEKRVVRDK